MKTFVYLFMPAFILLLSNCQKTTTAKGKVLNYISGKPVAGIPVFLTGYDGNNPRDSTNPDPCEMVETKTDANGEYVLEVSCPGMDKVAIWAGHPYAPFSNGFYGAKPSQKIRLGKANEIDFVIDSIDGKINFQFQNLKSTDDSIYVLVQCNALFEGPFLYCGGHEKITVAAGSTYSQVWHVTANRYVKYYWDKAPFTDLRAWNVDSVYCARNDSVVCNVAF